MNKYKLKKELDNIEKVLLEYFQPLKGTLYGLKILDNDSRKIKSNIYRDYKYYNDYYTGVTIKYLKEYLFNNKYKQNMIIYVLMKLLKEYKIQTLPCANIRKIVFENVNDQHYSRKFNDIKNHTYLTDFNKREYLSNDDIQYIKFFKIYNIIYKQLI